MKHLNKPVSKTIKELQTIMREATKTYGYYRRFQLTYKPVKDNQTTGKREAYWDDREVIDYKKIPIEIWSEITEFETNYHIATLSPEWQDRQIINSGGRTYLVTVKE